MDTQPCKQIHINLRTDLTRSTRTHVTHGMRAHIHKENHQSFFQYVCWVL
uniref:Uncharacterized protein n=1 Tax=Octopus bimaculoides TaxID=37653 RepID=A0A0L8HQ86_OCTBM